MLVERISFYAPCILLILLFSCVNKLELDIPPRERKSLHIEAKLVQGNLSSIAVEINSIYDLTPGSFSPVSVRDVHLLDMEENRMEVPAVGQGAYYRNIFEDDPIEIMVGQSYALEIVTQVGENIDSDFDKLLAVGETEELTAYRFQKDFLDRFEDFVKQSFIGFDITLMTPNVNRPEVAQNFRFDIERTYKVTDNSGHTCYISQVFNLDDEVTLTTSNLRGSQSVKLPLIDALISPYFAEGYYLNIYQQSLSQGAYKYWNSIHQVINRTGNMFESPAGKIRTNFSYRNEVNREMFGIFYATQAAVSRIYISPDFAGFPLKRCPHQRRL